LNLFVFIRENQSDVIVIIFYIKKPKDSMTRYQLLILCRVNIYISIYLFGFFFHFLL